MKVLATLPRLADFLLGSTKSPYFLEIDPTMRCNCRCDFCNIWRIPPTEDDFDIERKSESVLIRRLEEAWTLGCRFVIFGGGEPLVYKNLDKLVTKASEIGYYTMVITNGIALTEPAPWMKKLDLVAISFTMGKEVYEKSRQLKVFDAVKKNIEGAVDYGLNVVLFDTICNDTLQFFDETAEFAKKLGIKLHIFSVTEQPRLDYKEIDWVSKRPKNVFEEMKRFKKDYRSTVVFWENGEALMDGRMTEEFRCRAADTTITVKPDGSITLPCPAFPAHKSKPDDSLDGFWHSQKTKEIRARCGEFDFCKGCMRQYCDYHMSLIGKPLKAIKWLVQSSL